jgi:hypothetical protein
MNRNKIKTINFTGDLWRADKTAARNYTGAPIKYFALTEANANIYLNSAHREFMKQWRVKEGESLKLINILDRGTRNSLGAAMPKPHFNIAFPIKNNTVSRVSTENTKASDDAVLLALCELGGYDGYIMEPIKNVFHSEVGLCAPALKKLELYSSKRKRAPNLTRSRGPPGNNTRKNITHKNNIPANIRGPAALTF